MVTLDQGEFALPVQALAEALELVRSLRSPVLAACLLDVAGAAATFSGELTAARSLWDNGDALYKICGATRDKADAEFIARWRAKAGFAYSEQSSAVQSAGCEEQAQMIEGLELVKAWINPRIQSG